MVYSPLVHHLLGVCLSIFVDKNHNFIPRHTQQKPRTRLSGETGTHQLRRSLLVALATLLWCAANTFLSWGPQQSIWSKHGGGRPLVINTGNDLPAGHFPLPWLLRLMLGKSDSNPTEWEECQVTCNCHSLSLCWKGDASHSSYYSSWNKHRMWTSIFQW
jgi:hypothetical protein